MKIGELAEKSGMSRDTICFYEKIGLLPATFRDCSGHRDYDPSILIWVKFLGHMKATGMTLADMIRYAKLREQGNATGVDRDAIGSRRKRCSPVQINQSDRSNVNYAFVGWVRLV